MKLGTAALLATLAAATAIPAQAQLSPETDKLESGQFALDKAHAKIIFSYSHFGVSTSYGQFTDFDAKLDFDAKAPAKSQLDVTVNMDGINTNVAKLDAHLKAPDFFDAAKFPTAVFKSTGITVTGPNSGRITGDLTLHGVTKPVVLDATFNAGGNHPMTKKYVIGFNAQGKVKRTDFGVGLYAPNVGDEVTLTISSEFVRQ